MTAPLCFRWLSVRDFRNLARVELEPSPRFNVVSGDNGQGKTSLVEALYLVATTRSFRAEKTRETIRTGAASAVIHARVEEAGLVREHRAVVAPSSRSVLVDGKRPRRLAAYATLTPVVAFHPGDLEIVSGGAALRRKLLDRIALFLEPSSVDHRQRYERAQRARQVALETRGPTAADLDAFERLMAEHGAALGRARREGAERLILALEPAFERMLRAPLRLTAAYAAGGAEDAAEFTLELSRRRREDLRRGAATFGPHRDDLSLDLDGRSARRHASQGQQRILTLALKVAEVETVRAVRGAHPVLLLDDVSSELDPTRTGAVYDLLRETPGQVFVTTTRPELFETPGIEPGERKDWSLAAGALIR